MTVRDQFFWLDDDQWRFISRPSVRNEFALGCTYCEVAESICCATHREEMHDWMDHGVALHQFVELRPSHQLVDDFKKITTSLVPSGEAGVLFWSMILSGAFELDDSYMSTESVSPEEVLQWNTALGHPVWAWELFILRSMRLSVEQFLERVEEWGPSAVLMSLSHRTSSVEEVRNLRDRIATYLGTAAARSDIDDELTFLLLMDIVGTQIRNGIQRDCGIEIAADELEQWCVAFGIHQPARIGDRLTVSYPGLNYHIGGASQWRARGGGPQQYLRYCSERHLLSGVLASGALPSSRKIDLYLRAYSHDVDIVTLDEVATAVLAGGVSQHEHSDRGMTATLNSIVDHIVELRSAGMTPELMGAWIASRMADPR